MITAGLYMKKPVTVEAVQYDGDNLADVVQWISEQHGQSSVVAGKLFIHTLEGAMTVSVGDYVIKGVQGELYPCKPDIFHATYASVVTR